MYRKQIFKLLAVLMFGLMVSFIIYVIVGCYTIYIISWFIAITCDYWIAMMDRCDEDESIHLSKTENIP